MSRGGNAVMAKGDVCEKVEKSVLVAGMGVLAPIRQRAREASTFRD